MLVLEAVVARALLPPSMRQQASWNLQGSGSTTHFLAAAAAAAAAVQQQNPNLNPL